MTHRWPRPLSIVLAAVGGGPTEGILENRARSTAVSTEGSRPLSDSRATTSGER
jgi:hypothetical protein